MHSKENPFLAKVVERTRLSAPTCEKHTHHLVLDLSGSGLEYEVGDCIGVMPTNPTELVARTIEAMGATGEELIHHVTLQQYLTEKANISLINRGLLKLFAAQKPELASLLEREQKEAFQNWAEEREVWDLLEEHPEVQLSPEQLCSKLTKLMPRVDRAGSNLTTALSTLGHGTGSKQIWPSMALC